MLTLTMDLKWGEIMQPQNENFDWEYAGQFLITFVKNENEVKKVINVTFLRACGFIVTRDTAKSTIETTVRGMQDTPERLGVLISNKRGKAFIDYSSLLKVETLDGKVLWPQPHQLH